MFQHDYISFRNLDLSIMFHCHPVHNMAVIFLDQQVDSSS